MCVLYHSLLQIGVEMLDTLKLTLQNWSVSPGAKLQVNTGNFNFETGELRQTLLFQDTSGFSVNGSYAHYNGDSLNLSIKPIAGNVYAFATFSAPKRISEDNYYPIKESQFSEVFESVENELHENGIDTDIQEAKLSRVDTFKNILTDEDTVSYSRLFGLLQANRAKDKATHGATTWLMKNGSTQYCIYDKLEEMRNSGHSVEGLEKTLRFEYRCIRSSKVKSFFDMDRTTVKELKAYGWNAIQDRTIKAWSDNFFKYNIEDIEVFVESQIRSELQYFQTLYGRRFFSMYLKAVGAYSLTSSGSIEAVKRALENLDFDRMKIYRAEKELKDALTLIESLRKDSTSPHTLGELYSELKYKMEKVEA
jgi:hypothetical protein